MDQEEADQVDQVDQEEVAQVAPQTRAFSSRPRKWRMLSWPQSLSDYGAISGFHRAGARDSAFNYLRNTRPSIFADVVEWILKL